MDAPINEEGYTGGSEENDGEVSPSLERNASVTHSRESTYVHSLQCCSHDSTVNRIQTLQMSMQSLEFSIRELKEGQSKLLWKLIAVIGVTSFLCGYLGIHNWLNVLFG